ncbi:DEAD/DEAH box helicase [Rhizobium sp. CFBP 8762]|uniref:DEAD/DEAH box helicase n=1 Tax=Rhizobium sp. CFBP 8762 TaxID=2775279 RepID=UPI00178182CF|nr:DEAD/DEAH box helicase [Rhizobium sp. CFBP 8762]MBD8556548.1 DEAD/DEAH box helicase [Rhizobium sp. CFBP 8762]
MTTFTELGLSAHVLETLTGLGYEKPTPIQSEAIPLVMAGHDMIGLAQTGTGKTAAFGLPMIEKLMADGKRPDPRNIRALILAPTRELVNQIAANLKSFVKKTPIKIGLVVGGASINKQAQQLDRGVDILVATPGRLLDLIARKAVSLTQARYLVLDEADQMLDLGFIHDLRKISKLVPKNRQTLLFSATMPKQIADLASEYLTDPKKVEVTPPGKAADKVEQYVHFVTGGSQKTDLLKNSLTANPTGLAMVFSRTKHGAEKLMKHLDSVGFKAASIHGNKSQAQRERALQSFKTGEVRVLVATDVAARGIDIPGVTHVYNYDLPEVPDAYVHRIGRTARAGRDGIAIAYCAPDEIRLLRDIERLMNISIEVAGGDVPADQARPSKGRTNGNRGGGRPAGNGGQRQGQGRPGQGQQRREPRAAAPAPSSFAGDELLGDLRPAKKPHRKGQGPAAQAAHETAMAKRGNGGKGRAPRAAGAATAAKPVEWRDRPQIARDAANNAAKPGGQGLARRKAAV